MNLRTVVGRIVGPKVKIAVRGGLLAMIENLDPKSGIEYKTHGINPAKKIQRVLDRRAAEAKEDRARWSKDHPDREPGTSTRTWKSDSQVRFPTKRYRDQYDRIDWNG